MRITTIITVYNLERYVETALQSVFSQTRQPDEVIVIDDCSTDGSADIIRKYAHRIISIRLEENSGVLPAFIRGIEASSGDILTFLDGDDVWLPDKLENMARAFEAASDRVLVTHDYACMDGQGNDRGYTDDPTHINTAAIEETCKGDTILMDKLLRNAILCNKGVWLGSAFCINRKYLDLEKFREAMYAFPDVSFAYQDHPLAAFVLLENPGKKVFYIHKVLFRYRVFENNSSGVSNTLETALRTIRRSYASNVRTQYLVSLHPELKEENGRQKANMLYNRFLYELYNKQYAGALGKYFRGVFSGWNRQRVIKEAKRMLAVCILGPAKFLSMK